MPLLNNRLSKSTLLAIAWFYSLAVFSAPSQEARQRVYELSDQAIKFIDSHNYQRAAELLYQATALDPNNATNQYNLGLAFAELKRWRESWQAYQKAVMLKPDDGDSWLGLASAYYHCGDKSRAIATVKDVQKRFATSAPLMDRASALLVYFVGDSTAGATIGENGTNTATVVDLARVLESAKAQVAKSPNDVLARSDLAYLLTQTGKYKEAIVQLWEANRLNPKDNDFLKRIMYWQTKIGDLEGLQQTRKQFVLQFPNDPKTSEVKDAIKYYETDFKEIRKAAATNYDNDRRSFSQAEMPLKVYVPDIWRTKLIWSANAAQPKKTPKYGALVEKAFNEWSDASNKGVSFTFVGNDSEANVECEWTTDHSKLTHSFAGGECHSGTNSVGRRKAKAYILIKANDPNFDEVEFYNTTLHELGHALGLSHSSNPDDVMYVSGRVSNSRSAGLSAADKQRIGRLYSH